MATKRTLTPLRPKLKVAVLATIAGAAAHVTLVAEPIPIVDLTEENKDDCMPQSEPSVTLRTRLWPAFLLGGVSVAILAWFLWPTMFGGIGVQQKTAEESMQGASNIARSLIRDDAEYRAGIQAVLSGDYNNAESYLRSAYEAASDHASRGLIAYYLAEAYAANGKYADAVSLLSGIVADTAYTPVARAYATQALGLMFYRYRNPSITQNIFSQQPYAGMHDLSSDALSYRRLFEYASSFYPLSAAELHIADWYADNALVRRARGEEGADVMQSVSASLDHLRQAEDHMQKVESGLMFDPAYLAAVTRRAILYGKLAEFQSVNDVEGAYQKAFTTFEERGILRDGQLRLSYAMYLARTYGSSRTTDIQSIIQPLVLDPESRLTGFFVRAEEVRNSADPIKELYALVSSFAPEFETLLRTSGWTDEDLAIAQ